MPFILMIVAGLISSIIAKLLMPAHRVGGLFILGVGGSIIAGVMQYSEGQPNGLVAPFLGAIILLALYAVTARDHVAEKVEHDETRRAA